MAFKYASKFMNRNSHHAWPREGRLAPSNRVPTPKKGKRNGVGKRKTTATRCKDMAKSRGQTRKGRPTKIKTILRKAI